MGEKDNGLIPTYVGEIRSSPHARVASLYQSPLLTLSPPPPAHTHRSHNHLKHPPIPPLPLPLPRTCSSAPAQ